MRAAGRGRRAWGVFGRVLKQLYRGDASHPAEETGGGGEARLGEEERHGMESEGGRNV